MPKRREFVTIGKGTSIRPDNIGRKRLIATKDAKILIGKYCAIGPGTKIITVNHDYNFPAVQVKFHGSMFKTCPPGEKVHPPNRERTKGDVVIGNDVWLGEDVFIASGVTIGDGCCVGACSVVTRDLPPYSICVGTPCKPVKKRYNDDVRDFLLKLKWWDWDDDKIKRNKKFFYTNLNKVKDVSSIPIV